MNVVARSAGWIHVKWMANIPSPMSRSNTDNWAHVVPVLFDYRLHSTGQLLQALMERCSSAAKQHHYMNTIYSDCSLTLSNQLGRRCLPTTPQCNNAMRLHQPCYIQQPQTSTQAPKPERLPAFCQHALLLTIHVGECCHPDKHQDRDT
jgi:hypothetical protein